MSSPERVRRAHWFLLKAASKSVDRAGSRDQAVRIGVTANVGGDPRSTVFRRSARGPRIRRGQSPFGVTRNALRPLISDPENQRGSEALGESGRPAPQLSRGPHACGGRTRGNRSIATGPDGPGSLRITENPAAIR